MLAPVCNCADLDASIKTIMKYETIKWGVVYYRTYEGDDKAIESGYHCAETCFTHELTHFLDLWSNGYDVTTALYNAAKAWWTLSLFKYAMTASYQIRGYFVDSWIDNYTPYI